MVIKIKRLVIDVGFELVCFHCHSLDSTIKAHFRYLIRRLKGPFASMLHADDYSRVPSPSSCSNPVARPRPKGNLNCHLSGHTSLPLFIGAKN